MQTIGPFTFALSFRQYGKRWADTANTLRRPAYQNLDSWVSIRLPRNARLTVRGRNLTDDLRLPGAGTASGRLAAPRTYEASLTMGL
jgi:outer membrane receptor protein involved in Fe transport